MLSFLARRLIGLVLALLVASLLVFAALELLPGDAASLLLGVEARPDTLAALRHELGLDRPAALRYLAWIGDALRGELGRSQTYAAPVATLIAERVAVTAPLALLALTVAIGVALPAGLYAATRRDRIGDHAAMALTQLGLAVPEFWLGILLVLLFAIGLGWLPPGGFAGWDAGPGPAFASLLLPALTLGLNQAAILARVARSATLDALGADFVRTARAKGLSEARVLRAHVLRNAFAPMLTLIGLQLAFLLAGVIVVETLFYLPGLGRLLLQAVLQRDVVVVRDLVLLLVATVIAINLAVDAAQAALDPRPLAEA